MVLDVQCTKPTVANYARPGQAFVPFHIVEEEDGAVKSEPLMLDFVQMPDLQ